MIFDVDYFIKKFEAIPEDKWCTGQYQIDDKCCALGHCGSYAGAREQGIPEVMGLKEVLRPINRFISSINDGDADLIALGSTPKERILNALRQVKNSKSKT